mmetsp:Transcript_46498/g.129172  ORF Transcript_46498/g.129172 Transcript_46498/m.129172 type:complete len:297 (-) Transcript_46498:187-1077(-)
MFLRRRIRASRHHRVRTTGVALDSCTLRGSSRRNGVRALAAQSHSMRRRAARLTRWSPSATRAPLPEPPMQTRRARPEQLWAPLRRRPSTLDGRRSSQSLVSCLSCIAGADAGHIGTDEHCPARWAPRARIEWFSAVPRRCSSGAKAMASDRSSGGRAASERADSVRPAPDTSRAPCSRRQPRAPWAPHSSPRVRSTCSLGCAADPRWVCILECTAPPVRGWVPASLPGVENSFEPRALLAPRGCDHPHAPPRAHHSRAPRAAAHACPRSVRATTSAPEATCGVHARGCERERRIW